MPVDSIPSPGPRHQWRRKQAPPGRLECRTCGACSQTFPTTALVPEHQSDERGTTLFRAPGKNPPGWRTRSGPCIPDSVLDADGHVLPLLEAGELAKVRAAWSSLELGQWRGKGEALEADR